MNATIESSKENLTILPLTDLTAKLPKSFKVSYFLAKRLNDSGKLPARARFYTEGIVNRVIYGGYGDDQVKAELIAIINEHEAGTLAQ